MKKYETIDINSKKVKGWIPYSKMSTDELMQISVSVLSELQKRFMFGLTNIVFRQSKKALVFENSIPADRKGWMYLPFLRSISNKFQPEEDADGKIYRQLASPGTHFKIVSHDGVEENFVVTNGSESAGEINGSFLKGPIKRLQK